LTVFAETVSYVWSTFKPFL